jgi:hypothetical protein
MKLGGLPCRGQAITGAGGTRGCRAATTPKHQQPQG